MIQVGAHGWVNRGVNLLRRGFPGQLLLSNFVNGSAKILESSGMRILTYCDEDIGVAAGGSRQVLEFAKALALRGHEVTLVAPQSEREGAALTASIQVQAAFVPVARWGGL